MMLSPIVNSWQKSECRIINIIPVTVVTNLKDTNACAKECINYTPGDDLEHCFSAKRSLVDSACTLYTWKPMEKVDVNASGIYEYLKFDYL